MIGTGSCALALRGFFSLWLMLISSHCRGGSTWRTSFARSTIAEVVSSLSSSGRPLMRRPLHLPYCFRASWSSRSSWGSLCRAVIVASGSVRAARYDGTSSCRDNTTSKRSWLVAVTVSLIFAWIWESPSACSRASLKRTSCSYGSRDEASDSTSWLTEPLPWDLLWMFLA